MNEIKSFGGSRADLELISKSGAKSKSDVQIDEKAFSSEVASFLKQLQQDPSASEPGTSAKPAKESKKAVQKPNGAEAKQREVNGKRDAKDPKTTSKRQQKAAPVDTADQSTTAKRMGKGKKMVFDDQGIAQEARFKPMHTSKGPLRLEAVPSWMNQTFADLPAISSDQPLSHDRVTELLELGTQLLQQESRAYDDLTSSEASLQRAGGSIGTLTSSDAQFVRSLLSSDGGGTVSDRISALTLLVQSSPVHNTRHMESLLAMSRKKSREEAGRATRALADWLASEGGLGARKLRYFRDQPLLVSASSALLSTDLMAQDVAKSYVLLWAFEDYLKKFYFQFLQILETQSHDSIAFTRKQSVSQIFILLRDKPEQEQNMLRLLVNKLGDPERSVAAKTSNHILELLTAHPAMKFIVVREIANLVLRPASVNADKQDSDAVSNHNTHARYYGILTLNQTLLTARDEATANHLILLYFELFEGVLKQNEIKEAQGGDEEDAEDGKKKADKKRWRDQPKKGKGKGKKNKPQAVTEEPKLVKDAESKMVAAILAGVRRAFPFANLDTAVFEKHVNTLFKILHSSSFNICIQALQLIFQLTIAGPEKESAAAISSTAITDRFYRVLYDSLLDPRLESSSKQAMYLNLIFQALKADQEPERVKAFVKRICQILTMHQPSFVCGCLHLLGELFRRTPGLRGMLTEPEEDGEEVFADVPESDDEQDGDRSAVKPTSNTTKYDGRKREPRFANAGTTCLWDVLPLVNHFHPSVSVHALQLVQGAQITTNADLSLNTVSHFLDRFVYRNPKQKASLRGASAMQPMSTVGHHGSNVTRSRTHALAEDEFFNTEAFWKKHVDSVPADQLFFHKFFNLKSKQPSTTRVHTAGSDEDDLLGDSGDEVAPKTKAVPEADADDAESLDSDDDPDEREIWKAMKATMPGKEELQGIDDSDDEEDDEEFDYVDSDQDDEAVAAADLSDDEDEDEEEDIVQDEGEDVAADSDWDDQSDGGNVFEEEDDDLLPFTDFDADQRGTKRGHDEEDTPSDKKGKKQKENKKRKQAMQNMPTFASADDYAHLLGSDDDDDE